MYCSRCHGLLAKDRFLDMEGGFGEMWPESWRCLNCGAVQDGVIEQNRLAHQDKRLTLKRRKAAIIDDERYLGAEAFIRPAA